MSTSSQFYVLQRPAIGSERDGLAGTDAMPEEGFAVDDAPRCSECGRYVGMMKWLPPFRVELTTWGRQIGDVICLTETLIVTNRFRRLYEDHELTGLSRFDPVDVVKVTSHKRLAGDPPEFVTAGVVRSQTVLDQAASGVEWTEEDPSICPVCKFPSEALCKRWKHTIIESDTWAGEDIFIPRGGGQVITSSRFKTVCEANEVTNVVFVAAEESGCDYYPWETESDTRE